MRLSFLLIFLLFGSFNNDLENLLTVYQVSTSRHQWCKGALTQVICVGLSTSKERLHVGDGNKCIRYLTKRFCGRTLSMATGIHWWLIFNILLWFVMVTVIVQCTVTQILIILLLVSLDMFVFLFTGITFWTVGVGTSQRRLRRVNWKGSFSSIFIQQKGRSFFSRVPTLEHSFG